MKIAVIPARGGSKRIPLKNIREFCGKPMLAWSVRAALDSGCFDVVLVSTDDPAIADVAKQAGAQVPFFRPKELADDHTGTIPVMRHAIQHYIDGGKLPDVVCCIYATAPFVRSIDLQRGLNILEVEGSAYAFSVTSYAFPIQRAIKVTEGGRLSMFQPEHFNIRSQDLEEAFHDAGQFYWGRADAWLGDVSLFSEHSAPVLLPRHRVQDIDTLEDWERAEWLFRAMLAEEAHQPERL